MDSLHITFKKAGLFTSLQDLGREGHQDKGIPVGGALDRNSAQAANRLVGNEVGSPLIEITLLGPEIHFKEATKIAITGADFPVTLNGENIPSYQAIDIQADSILKFGYAQAGCRAYLAIAANWTVEQWLGSVSSVSKGSGFLNDHILQDGQQLTLEQKKEIKAINNTKDIHPINLSPIKRLRINLGPEFGQLSKKAIAQFFGSAHLISQDTSRMGYRLESELSLESNAKEMISSGILPGTVQLSSGGQPIILLADAQTTGGYPRIARIISEDLDAVAQLKPGDEVWFSLA